MVSLGPIGYPTYDTPNNCIKIHADLVDPGYATAYGQGLSFGYVNQPCKFQVNALAANESAGLSFGIEGPSKAELSIDDNNNSGIFSVSYLPTFPGIYRVKIQYGDKPIVGSPFSATIIHSNTCLSNLLNPKAVEIENIEQLAYVGKEFSFQVDPRPAGFGQVKCEILGPSETHLSSELLEDGKVHVRFTPRLPGDYVVKVKLNGTLARSINVICTGDGSASKILPLTGDFKVSGDGINGGKVNNPVKFNQFFKIQHLNLKYEKKFFLLYLLEWKQMNLAEFR